MNEEEEEEEEEAELGRTTAEWYARGDGAVPVGRNSLLCIVLCQGGPPKVIVFAC